MNFYTLPCAVRKKRHAVLKTLLIMKLIVVIICAVIFQASASVSLAQTVTLNERNAPLATVLKDIKKQTGYSFFYDESVLEDAHAVTINVKNKPLKEVLDACFQDQPLEFSINANTIGIKKKEKLSANNEKLTEHVAPNPPINISGKVTDSIGTPLISASVRVKGTKNAVITDEKGEFQIKVIQGDVLVISFIGFKEQEIPINGSVNNVIVQLKPIISGLKEVVISNGYQIISAERATGAYDQIDNQLLNRSTGTNIIDRLPGITSGVQIFGSTTTPINIGSAAPSKNIGLTVRGVATLNSAVGTSPLIVLDGFPFEGNIYDINPNDIESATILKDAAAASLWGAKAGNGVIILTSKHGKFRQKMQVDFNANTTILDKPNIFKAPGFLNASDYIDAETFLFNKGYYNNILTNTNTYPAYTPIVAILAQQRSGTLSATDATNEINAYRNLDVRNDVEKYGYQTGVNQQYSLAINGGSNDLSYFLSAGWDKNKDVTVTSGFNRQTLNAVTTYQPIKGLEINTNVKYIQYDDQVGSNSIGYGYPPYEMLADAKGNALPVTYTYSSSYINRLSKEGYLDWNLYPLNELNNTNYQYKNRELIINLSAKYKITDFLNIEAKYQNEYQNSNVDELQNQQSYAVTSLINKYGQYNSANGTITYNFPLGDIYSRNFANYNINNYRVQINLNKTIGDHQITGLAGGEIRKESTDATGAQFYGYDPQFGTFNNNLNFLTPYPTLPNGSNYLPSVGNGIGSYQYRYISYFGNLGYSYKDLYTLSVNGRKDGSNIFGVNINDKFKLLWSVGAGWNIDKEKFYQIDFIPHLKLRASYGFNGNVYNGSAYSVGGYYTDNLTNTQAIHTLSAPNPNLSWERVRNLNIGIDFALKRNILYGSIDAYRKDGLDLIEPVVVAPSSGYLSYTGNAANTKGKGLEIALNSDILRGQFKWTTSLIANFNSDILTNYSVAETSSSIQTTGGFTGIVGKPLYSIFSYKWAGLDPANGNPRGYLNGQVSENYVSIINNYKPDSLAYNGSAVPTAYGTLRNTFNYKKFTLSVMFAYETGFYFRRPSTTGNYTDLLTINGGQGVDYSKAWQKPGDELTTDVPSFVYPANKQRAQFYTYSQTLIENGTNIRLKDARLDYDLSDLVKHSDISRLSVFSYANNLALLWTANKDHLDPDAKNNNWIPTAFSISFGIQATLK